MSITNSRQLYGREDAASAAGPGWAALAREAWDVVTQAGGRVTCVKEKLATLVVYYEGTANVRSALDAISDRSRRTCQGCGQAGSLWRESWLLTLCARCAVEVYVDRRSVYTLGKR